MPDNKEQVVENPDVGFSRVAVPSRVSLQTSLTTSSNLSSITKVSNNSNNDNNGKGNSIGSSNDNDNNNNDNNVNLIDLDLMLHASKTAQGSEQSQEQQQLPFKNTLLILNQAIEYSFESFQQIWDSSDLVVCADGGGNRLFDYTRKYQKSQKNAGGNNLDDDSFVPNFIVGDLDSLRDEVKQYYELHGTIVKKQASQWATDFSKCVSLIQLYYHQSYNVSNSGQSWKQKENEDPETNKVEVEAKAKEAAEADLVELIKLVDDYDGILQLEKQFKNKVKTKANYTNSNNNNNHNHNDNANDTQVVIRCLGSLGGRFDHTIQLLSQLYKYHQESPTTKLIFLNNQDIIFLVPGGNNYIKFDNQKYSSKRDNQGKQPIGDNTEANQEIKAKTKENSYFGCNCGLLPVYGDVKLTTEGLKWDVKHWSSSLVSSRVSSSNRILDPHWLRVDSTGPLVVNIEADII